MGLETLDREGLVEALDILAQRVREAAEYLRIGEVDAARSIIAGALETVESLKRDESSQRGDDTSDEGGVGPIPEGPP